VEQKQAPIRRTGLFKTVRNCGGSNGGTGRSGPLAQLDERLWLVFGVVANIHILNVAMAQGYGLAIA
jgi:hypothetical protein